jgi:uncharacterized protein
MDTAMDTATGIKEAKLRGLIAEMKSALVAFSGGVDSTYLTALAHEVLGSRAVAVTAVSPAIPSSEVDEARRLAEILGIRHELIETQELDLPEYVQNNPDRCYHCKMSIFTQFRRLADDLGLAFVLDGSNVDDRGDYRPGHRALMEQGVRSPLQEAGLTKAEIRAISKKRGLSNWDRPSMACLASRVPYRTPITRQALSQIEASERLLRGLGLRQVRVRHYGKTARIEVEVQDIPRLLHEREAVVNGLTDLGYLYVTLDLAGYRAGSLNEGLEKT